jgi:hypothetical protein
MKLLINLSGQNYFIPWSDSPDFTGFDPAIEQEWNRMQSEGIEFNVYPDSVVPPDWDGFNTYILSDDNFNNAVLACSTVKPAISATIATAMLKYQTDGSNLFPGIFETFCQAANITAEQRTIWANASTGFNLPAAFISLVRGE